MAKKKTKDSSFSQSSLEKTDAYNAKNKVRIAKESLDKKKKQIKSLESAILKEAAKLKAAQKYVSDMRAMGVRYVEKVNPNMEKNIKSGLSKRKALKSEKVKLSQGVTERTRTASRASGIAKRESKKK